MTTTGNATSGRIAIRCGRCHGTDVGRDAFAQWDTATQQWALATVLDAAFCSRCGERARLEEVPLPDELPSEPSEELAVALHTLAKYCVIGARNPHHYQNVGLQHKHIVALLQALGHEPPQDT